MTLTRRALLAVTAGGLATSLLAGSIAFAQDKPQIGVVVKIGGIPWFNAMEVGIKQEAEKSGADAWMVGPTQADAAQQVRAIEDLIARGVDVIGIVPNDSAALAPVLGRAREAGIKVLAHEGPDQENMDWDFELTTTEAYGQAHMDLLAEQMGEEGEYIVYVGSLTVPLHNAWADAAIAYQKEKYPNMTMLGERFGVAESVDETDQDHAGPDARQPEPQGHPDLRLAGADRRGAGARGPRGRRRDRAGRRLLARAGGDATSRAAPSAAASSGTR